MLLLETRHSEDIGTYNETFTATLKDYKEYLEQIRVDLPVQVDPCVVLEV